MAQRCYGFSYRYVLFVLQLFERMHESNTLTDGGNVGGMKLIVRESA